MLLHSKILGDSENHILILHGFLGSGDNWITIARKLNFEGFTVHLIDQRNHGRSCHSENFDYQLMSNDLLKYIKHHKIKDPILIGHSMGGKTVMKFSLESPKLVRKLFVLDISPKEYPIHHQSIIDSLESLDFNSLGTRKTLAFVAESSWTPEGSGSGSFVANLVESDEVSWHTSFGGTVPPFTWCTAYVHYIGPT